MDPNSRAPIPVDGDYKAEVRFYAAGRSPDGHPDAFAPARHVEDGTSLLSSDGYKQAASFMAELVVPKVAGGALEFIIREGRGRQVVIDSPVRVTDSGIARD